MAELNPLNSMPLADSPNSKSLRGEHELSGPGWVSDLKRFTVGVGREEVQLLKGR